MQKPGQHGSKRIKTQNECNTRVMESFEEPARDPRFTIRGVDKGGGRILFLSTSYYDF